MLQRTLSDVPTLKQDYPILMIENFSNKHSKLDYFLCLLQYLFYFELYTKRNKPLICQRLIPTYQNL